MKNTLKILSAVGIALLILIGGHSLRRKIYTRCYLVSYHCKSGETTLFGHSVLSGIQSNGRFLTPSQISNICSFISLNVASDCGLTNGSVVILGLNELAYDNIAEGIVLDSTDRNR